MSTKTAPWIKFFAGDFLTGVADLEADEIGAYTIVLALIWDRGAPIADDAAWLARRSGTSTRRFNQIRAKLITLGKLEARNGLLGNRRAIEEVQARDKKSDQTRAAALHRWYGHGEPELPLGDDPAALNADYLGKKTRKKREKPKEQIDLKSSKNEQKPQKSANDEDADACFPSRAPAFQSPETRVIQSNKVIETAPLDRENLVDLMQAATRAAGFSPSQPGAIAREIDIVKEWRELGADFDGVVIPTIRSLIASSTDPTSSLKRFDRRMRLEIAKSAGSAKPGDAAYKPPAEPILQIEGEPEIMQAIRADLLKAIGPAAYCMFANPIRLEQVEEPGGDRNPLRIIDPRASSMQIINSIHQTHVRKIAYNHGFTDVW